jgi:hypothetical protein
MITDLPREKDESFTFADYRDQLPALVPPLPTMFRKNQMPERDSQ